MLVLLFLENYIIYLVFSFVSFLLPTKNTFNSHYSQTIGALVAISLAHSPLIAMPIRGEWASEIATKAPIVWE